jgi:hypothetical protein
MNEEKMPVRIKMIKILLKGWDKNDSDSGNAKKGRGLSAYELETIINFNQGENIAYVFTYEKTWQKRMAQGLGLKPTMDNGYGGKEYQLSKGLIPMPRAKRRYSEQTKKEMAARLANIQRKQPSLL